ncbi:hypothetical protein [Streptomyces sp. 4N124]|uniref:hypothetical protein n=1 Tax=Streptomyces sp. 4N124 TaxID=3457420 RepID=UPI003FD62307
MENTWIAGQAEETGEPLTDAEKEQAGYALWELARSESDPDALRVSHEQLETVRPFFELGWAMGVRTGHTGPAMTDVPVDHTTVARAFVRLTSAWANDALHVAVARNLGGHGGLTLWQKVRYHGSVTQRHGAYWVSAIHAHADSFGGVELRYDLSELRNSAHAVVISNVRLRSLTPLSVHRAF